MTPTHALYIHIPFCTHRCAYCDFNTFAGQSTLIPAYAEAVCREIEYSSWSAPGRITADTIFFGGGTPSLLTAKQFEQILRSIHDHFDLSKPEVSLEANPGTVTPESLQTLRTLGFNRISFGAQSFNPGELRLLERIHDPFDVFAAVKWARRAGFANLNLDLIFGLPEQTQESWFSTVKQAVNLQPEHLSLYALTIERGTPFGRWSAHGLMSIPDQDQAAEMYERASDLLAGEGYEQYEISNWSKPGYQCSHNLHYWRNQSYLGFGAGAHGYSCNMRVANVLRIKNYIARLAEQENQKNPAFFPGTPATVKNISISPKDGMQETMMTGLRLTQEGVSSMEFNLRFGIPLEQVYGSEIDKMVGLGLLEWNGGIIRLTKRGRLLGNQVFMHFVG